MKPLRFFSVHFPLDQLPSQTHSTQNITSRPLTPSFVSRFVCCRRRRAACCVPKNHDDSVGAHPAADVRATAGTPVSLPKQLCHQRWEVSLAMMDESDPGVSQQLTEQQHRLFGTGTYSRCFNK